MGPYDSHRIRGVRGGKVNSDWSARNQTPCLVHASSGPLRVPGLAAMQHVSAESDEIAHAAGGDGRSCPPHGVGAENPVISCDLHVLVYEAAESVSSQRLDCCSGPWGSSGACGWVLMQRAVGTVGVVVLDLLVRGSWPWPGTPRHGRGAMT